MRQNENLVNLISSFNDNCSELQEIEIASSITIEKLTFKKCVSLEKVTLPSTITKIDENAFNECKALTAIIISESVTTIGENAFDNCSSLKSVNIPEPGKLIVHSIIEIFEKHLMIFIKLASIMIWNVNI